jgi:hypothetical protein
MHFEAMARMWDIKPRRSLRENIAILLPTMYDEFFVMKREVVGHPRMQKVLHEMRLKGKMVRYVMETVDVGYGEEFKSCLEEFKRLLGLMGKIHDSDVQVPKLREHLTEIRMLNKGLTDRRKRISTLPLVQVVRQRRAQRRNLFNEVCGILERWEHENFRAKLVIALARKQLN